MYICQIVIFNTDHADILLLAFWSANLPNPHCNRWRFTISDVTQMFCFRGRCLHNRGAIWKTKET